MGGMGGGPLPGSVCGVAVPRAHLQTGGGIWREALRGTTQAGCLAAPGAHIRDRHSTPHPAWNRTTFCLEQVNILFMDLLVYMTSCRQVLALTSC